MKPAIPKGLMDLSSDIVEFEEETILASCQNSVQNYESFKQRRRDGELGKTAKFWIMYLDLMKYQQMAHTAVQKNECPGKYAIILLLLQQDKLCKVWNVLCSAVAPSGNAISWNETST